MNKQYAQEDHHCNLRPNVAQKWCTTANYLWHMGLTNNEYLLCDEYLFIMRMTASGANGSYFTEFICSVGSMECLLFFNVQLMIGLLM